MLVSQVDVAVDAAVAAVAGSGGSVSSPRPPAQGSAQKTGGRPTSTARKLGSKTKFSSKKQRQKLGRSGSKEQSARGAFLRAPGAVQDLSTLGKTKSSPYGTSPYRKPAVGSARKKQNLLRASLTEPNANQEDEQAHHETKSNHIAAAARARHQAHRAGGGEYHGKVDHLLTRSLQKESERSKVLSSR